MRNDRYAQLIKIVQKNENLMKVFDALDKMEYFEAYIGAGAIVQSVWNELGGRDINYGIGDIDIVFYNDKNIDEDYENIIRKKLENELGDFPIVLDIKNQARVHLWYQKKFGYEVEAYESVEDAVNSWPTTATSIALKRYKRNKWMIYAPFGIDDVFDMLIKANSRQVTKEIYMKKAEKWKNKWNELKIIDWDGIEPEIEHRLPVVIKL